VTSPNTLLDNAFRAFRDNTFLVSAQSDRTLTYARTETEVRSLAQELDGIVPGRTQVAFLADNSVDYVVTCLALLYSGRSVFLLSPDWPDASLRRHLADLDVSHLVTDRDVTQYCGDEGAALSNGMRVGGLGGSPEVGPATVSEARAPRVHVATSGTTGLSKWVPKELGAIRTNLGAWADRLDLTQRDRVHSMLPLCTANGVYITFLMPFFSGASVVLDRRFSLATLPSVFENILRYESTVLSTVPAILNVANIVLGDDVTTRFSRRTRARLAICGTAPLSPDGKRRFASRTGVPVLLNFGTTETMFAASQSLSDWEHDDCGPPLDGMTMEIEPDGQLRVRGPEPFLPYWNRDPGGFQPDGSYLTGDLGSLADGRLRITGRKTDMVIVGGFNVHPVEIDRVIIDAPGVLDCFTFGAPNRITGEELVSAVVLREGVTRDGALDTVRTLLEEVLPAYKIPRLEAVSEIAKTPTGKPVKREMQIRLGVAVGPGV
jgi:acyl-CoA synthetase (AMP-forming)/AMP-acid ligase II